MRSHAKAPSAGPDLRQAKGLGRIVIVLSLALLAALVFAASAQAGGRVKSSEFGSAGTAGGQFNNVADIAVNAKGNGGVEPGALYTVESANNRIQQFSAGGSFVRAWGYDVVKSGQDNTGANEQQKLLVKASGGKFALSFEGKTTGASATSTYTNPTSTLPVSSVNGTFAVGQVVTSSGTGIVAGTTILSCSPSCAAPTSIELSQSTTGTGLQSAKTIEAHNLPYNATAAEVETALNALSTIGGAGGSVSVSRSELSATEIEYTVTFGGSFAGNDVPQLSATTAGLEGTKTVTPSTSVPGGGFETCKATASPADVCKAGLAVGSAGAMSAPQGIAVDPVNGNLFVTDEGNRRVDVFSATGAFEGAFGWGVADNPTPGPQTAALEFCTATCFTGLSGAGAGEFGAKIGHPAIDTSVTPHRLYVASPTNLRVDYFAPTLTGNTVTGVSFVKTLGWDVVSSGPDNKVGTVLELCNPAANPTDVCKAGASVTVVGAGGFYNQASSVVPVSIAVAGDGSLLADVQKGGGNASAESPTRVFKFTFSGTGSSEAIESADFAPGSLFATSGKAIAVSNFVVTIDQSTGTVMVAKKTTETAMNFLEFDGAGTQLSVSPHSPLTVNNSTGSRGLAFGTEGRLYFADGAGNKVYVLTPPPAPSATISATSGVTTTTAVLHGKVTPPLPVGGEFFATSYNFEFSADGGVTWQSTKELQAGDGSGSIEVSSSCPTGNPQSCNVSQEVSGLQPNKGYLARLRANTGTVATSATASFTTAAAPPTVSNPFSAEAATQTSAKILAIVNPNNQPTTYHFEWGETTSYGNEAPPFEAFAGSGGEDIRVAATLSGLSPATTYHFRLVAKSPSGTTVGTDQQFETLNHCGLPDNRCYELVSPPDKGAAGVVTTKYSTGFPRVAPDGDSIVFPYLNPDEASAGSALMYLGERSEEGWSSSQITPPSLIPIPAGSLFGGAVGIMKFLAPDLSCAIFETHNPLTADVPAVDPEYGIRNLFRRDAEGSYQLLTSTIPTGSVGLQEASEIPATVSQYNLVSGASPDCRRVYFSSVYQLLPGSPSGLYESEDGTVRDVGLLPDGTKPAGSPVVSISGGESASASANAVSEDGSKVFFTAQSDEAATNEKKAIFMHEVGAPASVEITKKQGGAHDSLGSRFEAASKDGSHVFFPSSYGLTPSSSSGPAEACDSFTAGEAKACDLYDYDTETGDLTDLSADSNLSDTKGAVVQLVLATSEEGERVYFSAMGQLVAGKGKTYAENTAGSKSVNVYLSEGGTLRYVTTVGATTAFAPKTTPDGRHLLFATASRVTDYDNGGLVERYLYSSETGEVQCVSCPRDGQPGFNSSAVFQFGQQYVSDDGSRVFFTSRDVLAPGAVLGNVNIFEWERGQVYLLVAGQGKETATSTEELYGASPSGDDFFLGTIAKLDPRDVDDVSDLYDARAGGGFAPPPTPEVPCDPAADQCQGAPATPPAAPNPASGAAGSGNPPESSSPTTRCRKGTVRRHGRCIKPRKHKRTPAHKRATHTDRGGAK